MKPISLLTWATGCGALSARSPKGRRMTQRTRMISGARSLACRRSARASDRESPAGGQAQVLALCAWGGRSRPTDLREEAKPERTPGAGVVQALHTVVDFCVQQGYQKASLAPRDPGRSVSLFSRRG